MCVENAPNPLVYIGSRGEEGLPPRSENLSLVHHTRGGGGIIPLVQFGLSYRKGEALLLMGACGPSCLPPLGLLRLVDIKLNIKAS